MQNAYLIAGMRLPVLLRLALRHGVSPRHLGRLLFLTQAGAWSGMLATWEALRRGDEVRRAPLPADPVFIVNHWRTGSTFLHQCLSCDPRFTIPTLLQCCYPTSFVTARRFAEPLMAALVPKHRPMDNVKLGPSEPQEDEDAVFRMTGLSPLERLIFPHGSDYFLHGEVDFVPRRDADLRRWERAFVYFIKKLAVHGNGGGRVVLKNPFNAMRVPLLARLFPGAVFIHTYRDPRAVIPSTLRLWSIVGSQNALRADCAPPPLEQVVQVFDRVLTQVRADLAALPRQRWMEIRFEDLEQRPVDTLRCVYSLLGMAFDGPTQDRLAAFLASVKDYRKNRHELSAEHKAYIERRLQHHMQRDGYLCNSSWSTPAGPSLSTRRSSTCPRTARSSWRPRSRPGST
jgi:omega-hydroxy-beta-dihydromenaquinone-9 sulfotransferase